MRLGFIRDCAMPGGYCIFCNNHFRVKFSFNKNVSYMSGYNRLVSLKEFRQLILSKPNRVFFKSNIETSRSIRSYVYNYFST